MKKLIIWTSDTYLDDDAREEYQQYQREILENEEYCVTDHEWAEVVDGYLADERMNLDKEVEGVIIAFAGVGTWNGGYGAVVVDYDFADLLFGESTFLDEEAYDVAA